MKQKLYTLSLVLSSLVLLTGCIASEPLEIQCDIESLMLSTVDGSEILRSENDLKDNYKSSVAIAMQGDMSDAVFPFYVKEGVEISKFIVNTTSTKGTRVFLLSDDGTEEALTDNMVVDFSSGGCTLVTYSEGKYTDRDGQKYTSSRRYTVSVKNDSTIVKGDSVYVLFDFNGNYALEAQRKKYYVWTETDKTIFTESDATWKNGNPGFLISRSSAAPMDYPSVPVEGGGMDGSDCVKLETRDTGSFGSMVGCPIAAGSLFNGKFNVARATSQPRKSTLFGVPCPYIPVYLEADLKYIPGEKFQDQKKVAVENVVDEPDIYCVFYNNHGGTVVLDGDNILTSADIVASARLKHNYTWTQEGDRWVPTPQLTDSPIHGVTGEWKHVKVKLNFDPFKKGVDNVIDLDTLKACGYSVVFGSTSSWRGAIFEGALGSQLYFDNVKITMFNPKEDE